MAEPIAFHYLAGNTRLHRLDPRIKIACLGMATLCTLIAYPAGLLAVSAATLSLLLRFDLPVRAIAKDLRMFCGLLLMILITRALVTPGNVWVSFLGLEVSAQGVFDGLLICWRLLLLVVMGVLFTATTRPKEIRGALERILAPIPLVPEKQLATMVGLIVRFVPVLWGQAHETMDALKARGLSNRRNPVYRLRCMGLALLRRSVIEADDLALAMESRGFTYDRTPPCFHARPEDWWTLLAVGGFCVLPTLSGVFGI